MASDLTPVLLTCLAVGRGRSSVEDGEEAMDRLGELCGHCKFLRESADVPRPPALSVRDGVRDRSGGDR